MKRNGSESETRQFEMDADQLDVVHELILRGLRETDFTDREYGEAYDAFIDAAGYPLRIGDQPERVQNVWEEIIEQSGEGRRQRPRGER